MSGLRRCNECGNLFKVQDAGPEPMQSDGTFPKHVCGRCLRTREAILDAIAKLREEDFRFTVEVTGPPWDVYYVSMLGNRPALVAVRLVEGRAEIGAIGEAHFDEEQMKKRLREGSPS